MPGEEKVVSKIYIKVDNSDVSDKVMAFVQEVVVDQSAYLPTMFTISVQDKIDGKDGSLKMLDSGPFDLTKEVEIEAADEDGTRARLVKGEITALELNTAVGMDATLLVRGYDKSHRLHRNRQSRTFLNQKDSDIVEKMAQEAGLGKQVENTGTVYDYVIQKNQTNMDFLQQRARRIGFEVFAEDNKLVFRKPPNSSGPELTLKAGKDLQSFKTEMNLANQVSEVQVLAWDNKKKETIVGKAKEGKAGPKIGESKSGAQWAKTFGKAVEISVDQPVNSQAEADTHAEAKMNELSGSFVQAEGSAFRRPDIKPGIVVKIEGNGKRLSGEYLVTSAIHIWNLATGLSTQFAVSGTPRYTLYEQISPLDPVERSPGVASGIVTNTADPENMGRVKVKLPWTGENVESDWVRVLGIGAGPERGLFIIPEVEDEVLVAFAHGDINHPYVLGGLWNSKDKIPGDGAAAGSADKPKARTWTSQEGHKITMHDDISTGNKIDIVTAGGHKISLDDKESKLEIVASGGGTLTVDSGGNLELNCTGKCTIESKGDMELKAMNMKLGATKIDIEGSSQVNVKAPQVNLN